MESNNQKQSSVAKPPEDLDKVCQELQLELREKILGLHEELLPLREEVGGLRVRFLQASAIGAVLLAVLTVFGVKEWWSLPTAITEEVKKQVSPIVEKQTLTELRFAEQLQTAVYISQGKGGSTQQALKMLQRLAGDRKSQNEVLFSLLTECYIRFDKCNDGYTQLRTLEKNGLKSEALELPSSLRNYGFILWVRSLYFNTSESEIGKDVELLRKSLEQAEKLADKEDIRAAAEMLVLVYLSRGEIRNARDCANVYLKGKELNWSKYTNKDWFEKLKERRTDVQVRLREMFPGSFSEAKVELEQR